MTLTKVVVRCRVFKVRRKIYMRFLTPAPDHNYTAIVTSGGSNGKLFDTLTNILSNLPPKYDDILADFYLTVGHTILGRIDGSRSTVEVEQDTTTSAHTIIYHHHIDLNT